MNKEKLGLQHKDLLRERLKKLKNPVSEYSFANLYLFRETHRYELIFDDELLIAGITYGGEPYVMPVFDIRKADPGQLRKIIEHYRTMFPLSEDWIKAFAGDEYLITTSEGDWDYVYAVEKMRTYPGKKLHAKRNLLKQFMESYAYESLPLTEAQMPDAEKILDAWQKEMGTPKEETDFDACKEALVLYEKLSLCGGIYYADGLPAGFILGEELNEKVYAIHFAKGIRDFKGIYQFMYNSFAKIMPAQYYSFNFEQDLGKEGMRQAKSSYHPDYMIKKYRVRLR